MAVLCQRHARQTLRLSRHAVCATPDVAYERRRQRMRVASGQRPLVGKRAAVKPLPHGTHTPAYGHVGHPQFPEVEIHVGEHRVEDGLRIAGGGAPASCLQHAQAADEQGDEQAHEVETPIERVRHAEVAEIHGVARRLDGRRVKLETAPP